MGNGNGGIGDGGGVYDLVGRLGVGDSISGSRQSAAGSQQQEDTKYD